MAGGHVWQGRGHVWQGGMHDWGMHGGGCALQRGMCGRGHACHAPPNPDTMRYGQSMRGRECILIYFNTFLLHWFASTVQQFHHDEKSCFASQGQGLLYLCFPG